MHIENLTVNLHASPHTTAQDGISLIKRIMSETVAALAATPSAPHQPETLAGTTPPAAGEIWPGQGGHYICTLPAQWGLPARHLVLGTATESGLEWGGSNSDCVSAKSHVDGRANTAALLADHTQHPAARWASKHTAEGHTDFFLPSRYDLLMCYLCAPHLFERSGWYWSSTQYSSYDAWCQHFEYGDSHAHDKDYEFRARPVRKVHLHALST